MPTAAEALNKAYEGAQERIESHGPEYCSLAKRVISWITYAQKPLLTEELQHAVAVEPEESELDADDIPRVETMIAACEGLVTVDDERNIIRVPNTSAYLLSTCITYMSLDTFAEGRCAYEEELAMRLSLYPFLDYAASYWEFYAQSAGEMAKEVVRPFVQNEQLVSSAMQAVLARVNPNAVLNFSWSTQNGHIVPFAMS